MLGYRELERYLGDSNVSLSELRQSIVDCKTEQLEQRKVLLILNEATKGSSLQNQQMYQEIYMQNMNLHQRVRELEEIAPPHPPSENSEMN